MPFHKLGLGFPRIGWDRAHRGKHFWWTVIPLCVLLAALYSLFFLRNPAEDKTKPGNKRDATIIIPENASDHQIADSLASHGLLRSEITFRVAAKLLRAGHNVHGGTFTIARGLSNTEIIRRLTGTTYQIVYFANFPEGINMKFAAVVAASNLGIDSAQFMRAARDTALLHYLGVPKEAQNAEGYLYPDSYKWLYPVDGRTVVMAMIKRWHQIVTPQMVARADSIGLTVHQLMTLASIVEGETKLDTERYIIAGVYWNRLHINMLLQADPTVQYGLHLDRPIGHADLLKPSPYNTYKNKGLPPGPINNPTYKTILATLYPAQHNALFFVARRDGSNGHFFAHSMADQNKNINKEKRNISGHG